MYVNINAQCTNPKLTFPRSFTAKFHRTYNPQSVKINDFMKLFNFVFPPCFGIPGEEIRKSDEGPKMLQKDYQEHS